MCGEDILHLLPVRIRCMVEKLRLDYGRLWEIRLRVNSPFILRYEDSEIYVDSCGSRTCNMKDAYIVTARDVNDTLECICNHSLYAYEDEIRQGFITVCGGHRVGVAGKIILDGTRIKCIRHISFLNIRVAHEIKGCSGDVLPYIYNDGKLMNTLIVSAPCHGKTTLLRDIIRVVSDGGMTVGVVDERSEIAACYKGVPQNDVGMRTDVLDCCPKASGMMMLVRTMAPDLIAVDEIGRRRHRDRGLIDPLRVIQRLQKAAGRKGLLLFYYRKCKGSAKPAASHFLYSYLAQTQRSKSSEWKAASFDA